MAADIHFDFLLHDAERSALEALNSLTKEHPMTWAVFNFLKSFQCRKLTFHNWENVLLCVKFIDHAVTCPHKREHAIVATIFKDCHFNPFSNLWKISSANFCFDNLFNILGVSKGVAEEIRSSILKINTPKLRQSKMTELEKLVTDVNFIRLASKWEAFLDISKMVLAEKGYRENTESLLVRGKYFRLNFPMTLSRNPTPIFLSSYAHPYEAAARENIKAFLLGCKAASK